MTDLPATFDEIIGLVVGPEVLEWLERFIGLLDDWMGRTARGPMTIAHADYRLENMLFDADNTVTLIDWQTAMFTAGATDLAFFCGTRLDTQLRRELEQELLDRYQSALLSNGVATSQLTTVARGYSEASL